MSYCRWSSNDWDCDVYVYADESGGWTTHVAANRHRFNSPLPEPVLLRDGFTDEEFAVWADRHRVVSQMVDAAELVPIGLPYDSESFHDDSPGECADTLTMLRDAGYHVPADAIQDLCDEQVELAGAGKNVQD